MNKPYSPAIERNKGPIFEVLEKYILKDHQLLEIGSGTGQHAVYFAEKFPDLVWVTSDVRENHEGILEWLNEVNLPNIKGPKN